MKIKIIIENNPSPSDKDLLSEHGFSTWIKYPEMKLYAGHCKGSSAIEILPSELGSQLETLYSGKEIIINV